MKIINDMKLLPTKIITDENYYRRKLLPRKIITEENYYRRK